jgi:hypothetical protein
MKLLFIGTERGVYIGKKAKLLHLVLFQLFRRTSIGTRLRIF